MSIEKIKTIILYVLVLLSALLTWQLWVYQPDYDTLGNLELVKKYTVGKEESLNEVIRPEQVVLHVNNRHLSTFSTERHSPFYEKLLEASFDNFRDKSLDEEGREELLLLLERKDSVEFVFPTAISMEMYAQLFEFNDEQSTLQLIDRIVVYEDNNRTMARFISYKEGSFIEARLINQSFAQYNKLIEQESDAYQPFFMEILNVAKPPVYLPENPISLTGYDTYPPPLDEDEFMNALFNDISFVRKSSQAGGETLYTDGSHELKVNNQLQSLIYINPSRNNENETDKESSIVKSFRFINGHGGWTDSFVLHNWSPRTIDEITYRLIFNGYPAFGSPASKIEIEWQGAEVLKYERSLLSIERSISPTPRRETTLSSGYEVIDYLKSNSNYDISKINKITVGYSITTQSTRLSFTPTWFIHYQDTWEALMESKQLTYEAGERWPYGLE
jgi:regulatory protein YycH of two-component signal transduction system YycFG